MPNLQPIAAEVILACAGYLLGSISIGYYLVRRLTGRDLRTIGSGSTGSANAGRVLGRAGYAATLLGDAAKGALAMWGVLHLGNSPWSQAVVMIAVLAGHIWPFQLGFRGGKGLAPGIGMVAVLDFPLAIILGIISALGLLLRVGKAGLLIAAASAPTIAILLGRRPAEIAGLATCVLLILFAHRANIRAFLDERRGRKGLQACPREKISHSGLPPKDGSLNRSTG
jgi:glycerol-3-phosphate acyltransferase PlsY